MLLAFQVPQGNLKLLDAHPELLPWETRDRLHASPWGRSRTMVTVASRSQMRGVLSAIQKYSKSSSQVFRRYRIQYSPTKLLSILIHYDSYSNST